MSRYEERKIFFTYRGICMKHVLKEIWAGVKSYPEFYYLCISLLAALLITLFFCRLSSIQS